MEDRVFWLLTDGDLDELNSFVQNDLPTATVSSK